MPSIKSKTKLVADPRPLKRFEFEAIGTSWAIDIFEISSSSTIEALLDKVKSRIEEFDQTYSRFRSDSLVTQMSKQKGKYTLPKDSKKLLDIYKKLYDITGGKMTPLIGNVISDAGYDATYSLVPSELTTPMSWSDAMDFDYPYLTVKSPMILDFGAAGKGYLVDIVGELLFSHGVTSFGINAGGDIVYHSQPGQRLAVGLEHPLDHTLAVGVASILNQSICGSSGSRRQWADFHHIIDPDTLTSPDHILATWVVADTALIADGLATALYFTDAEILGRSFDFEYAMLMEDNSLNRSINFPAEFFMGET